MALPDLGPYRTLERLGAGAYGDVILAEDTRLRRRVAIKTLVGTLHADTAELRRRLLREARAAARLNHPNIAAVYDVLESSADVHIVMEYVPGTTLAARLRTGPLPPMEVLDLGLQLSSALTHAHGVGVIHRDLKPANIMITAEGQAKILDFGLARLHESDLSSTDGTGERHRVVGTPPYIPPEHLRGAPVDARGDVYSLGVTLFELLTGRRPFEARDGVPLETAILTAPTPRPRSVRPDVPEGLDEIVYRAIARAPEERYDSAARLEGDLNRLASRISEAPTRSQEEGSGSLVALGSAESLDRDRSSLNRFVPERLAAVSRHRPRVVWTAAALLVLGGGLYAAKGLRFWLASPTSAVTTPTQSVVAVLPLSGAAGDPETESLAAGVADALITSLAKVPGLTVVSRSATLKYRNRSVDTDAVARELGATLVVDGALQRSGDDLRLTMTVLQPGSNLVRWRGAYDGKFAEVFTLQKEVADAVAAALRVASAPKTDPARPPTQNVEAFAEYAQARSFLERPDVKENLDRSITLFQGALAKDPNFARAHAGLGEAFWRKFEATREQDWATKARDEITEALRLDPADTSVRQSLAALYRGLGRFDQAIDELRRVTAAQPGSDDAHRLLGQILIERGKHAEGVAEIQEAIRLRPQYWAHHAALGQAYYKASRYGEAIPSFRRVTQLQPDSAWGYQMLGAAYHSMDDTTNAIPAYEKAIALGNAKAHGNLGTIYSRLGRTAEALRHWNEALQREPLSALNHHNVGTALERLGRTREARVAYQRSVDLCRQELKVRPENAPTLALLAVTESKLGATSEAIDHVARAAFLAPHDPDVQYARAKVMSRAGRIDQAVEALRRAVAAGHSPDAARRDPDLAALKRHPAYTSALSPPTKVAGGST